MTKLPIFKSLALSQSFALLIHTDVPAEFACVLFTLTLSGSRHRDADAANISRSVHADASEYRTRDPSPPHPSYSRNFRPLVIKHLHRKNDFLAFISKLKCCCKFELFCFLILQHYYQRLSKLKLILHDVFIMNFSWESDILNIVDLELCSFTTWLPTFPAVCALL